MGSLTLDDFAHHVGRPVEHLYRDVVTAVGSRDSGRCSATIVDNAGSEFHLMLVPTRKSHGMDAIVWAPNDTFQVWLRNWDDTANDVLTENDITQLREALDAWARGAVRCFECGEFVTLDSNADEHRCSYGVACERCWPIVRHLAETERRSHRRI